MKKTSETAGNPTADDDRRHHHHDDGDECHDSDSEHRHQEGDHDADHHHHGQRHHDGEHRDSDRHQDERQRDGEGNDERHCDVNYDIFAEQNRQRHDVVDGGRHQHADGDGERPEERHGTHHAHLVDNTLMQLLTRTQRTNFESCEKSTQKAYTDIEKNYLTKL